MVDAKNLQDLIVAFGGFHDSKITLLNWSEPTRVVKITIDKLYANFEGLATIPKNETVNFVFSDARFISCAIFGLEGCKIFDCELSFALGRYILKINLSPAGSLEISYSDVYYPEIPLPVEL